MKRPGTASDRDSRNKDIRVLEQAGRGCASTVMVSFGPYTERVASGQMVSLDLEEKFPFKGLDQMLLIMDDLMDAINYPQASFSHRSLGDTPFVFEKIRTDAGAEATNNLKADTGEMADDKDSGKKAAAETAGRAVPWRGRLPGVRVDLIIRVYYRQQGSMQGELTVTGRGGGKSVRFRSALELMRMVHEFLREQ